ncbi:phosphoenolpyruvate synthase [Sulfuricurvum kujiense DSM 16994]|uniref:Phosphoenolpyruvate synthase n=1 Tax=Sulfuricurvum kujiense (strain ATCC BAA-921 / DSM 16994 / JCM 11577 / YK-1) TaxID=709032 RepID=E4U335_SULKY|nr:pyruvate, water dikinase [Sulfuricurvum kujiense]ADR33705.1 phosphoenolpyruvate synthase [Sulfuricurvum kujiense DSM 16994]
MNYIRRLDSLRLEDIALVGGKNASLGEMIGSLKSLGVKVPEGFAVTADGYRAFIAHNQFEPKIRDSFKGVDLTDIEELNRCGNSIRTLMLTGEMPEVLKNEISESYRIMEKEYGMASVDVAVRSSATAEDLPDASFAGQQESYLNVRGETMLIEHVKRCFASLFTDRAISYRHSRGYDHFAVALSVGVQKMVRSDLSSSGIMFTIDTENGSDKLILINSIWGLGENIVGGRVNPDEFYVYKPTLKANQVSILKRQLGSKALTMTYDERHHTMNLSTPKELQEQFSINDDEVATLARYALLIEDHYTILAGEYRPMDIEWAKDGMSGELFIVQARPETVQSQKLSNNTLEQYRFKEEVKAKILLSGKAIGEKIGSGNVKIIHSPAEGERFNVGDVLVADITDPDWEPIMKKASAVITNRGGRTCHAAIVAREIGVPAIVGTVNATELLYENEEVSVSCAEGENGHVYEGLIPYEITKIDLGNLAPTKTKLYMNVGNPDSAFKVAKLPNDGVGLARMEFIITNYVKAHPMALVELSRGKKIREYKAVKAAMKGYDDPKMFFIDKLSEGVGMIAAAFYPRPVVVRTSDFKSNEYKHMVGGAAYESDEENPMIGFRGASRYYSQQYREAFEWECEALKRVRDDMGLDNVKVMLPFVRTPEEGRKAIAVMNEAGLVQGENALEIYAMCEIPSNVILADQFLEIFDGYSIGSNDLTQLTLGVDRDSTLVAAVFDERNDAVTRMLSQAIRACKERGKYIGICGQAPSDYPEITRFLVEEGIDSISLNPDSLLKMRQVVSAFEAKQ